MEQALLLSNSAQAAGSLGAGGNGERHAAPAGRQGITLYCTPGWMQRLAVARTAATSRGSRRARSYREQGGAAGRLAVVAVLVFLACGALGALATVPVRQVGPPDLAASRDTAVPLGTFGSSCTQECLIGCTSYAAVV